MTEPSEEMAMTHRDATPEALDRQTIDPWVGVYSAGTLKAARSLLDKLGGDERHLGHTCLALDDFAAAATLDARGERDAYMASYEQACAERDASFKAGWDAAEAALAERATKSRAYSELLTPAVNWLAAHRPGDDECPKQLTNFANEC